MICINLYVNDHGVLKRFEFDEILDEIRESIELDEMDSEEQKDQISEYLSKKYEWDKK